MEQKKRKRLDASLGFSLTYILPYKDRIYNSLLIRENKGQWKPVFSDILYSAERASCENMLRLSAVNQYGANISLLQKVKQKCAPDNIWSLYKSLAQVTIIHKEKKR